MQKKVLLVDDESSLRRSLSVSLSQEGYEIEPCENGVNALRKLDLYKKNNTSFDTIVLDIKLPDIDGIKLGKIFRTQYPESNIIFITGYADNLNTLDMQNISSSALLEKPFTAEDLTFKMREFDKEKESHSGDTAAKPAPAKVPTTKTFSAYALLKLDETADFFQIYRQLYFDKNVLYCDATTGDFDIILLVQAGSMDEIHKLSDRNYSKISGIKNIELLEVSSPILEDSLKNVLNIFSIESSNFQTRDLKNVVSSYVLVEVAKEKLDSIYPTLLFDDNIVYCDYTNSIYSLVLLVKGRQFTEIDNLVKNKIAPMDGVLKVKEYPIITIFEM